MTRKILLCLFGVFLCISAGAQDLSLGSDDFRIEQLADGGFHLYIRKKPDIGSVLITESTRDPALRSDNYAYRAPAWNPVNGDEMRLLNDAPIPRENNIYSLIDSTTENHPELGAAFHIFIPWILNYGYENARHGEIYVTDGTYLNIRAFRLPFADYRSNFQDNPFVLRVTQKPLEGPPESNYMKETEESFKEIAAQGYLEKAEGPSDLVERIKDILENERGKAVDIVLCLDTTASMKDDIDAVRRAIIPMLKDIIAEFSSFRIGLVLYKDYNDEYLTKTLEFTEDFTVFQRNLNSIQVRGGRDIPEAVYEALYDGATKFPWAAQSRVMILIGDAPPHPRQRGKISKEMVDAAVAERNIKVSAIILPQ
jgi:hypothetical protein